MKLGMVQMCMSRDAAANEEKALRFCDEAKGCDLVFFPEVQYAPFFAPPFDMPYPAAMLAYFIFLFRLTKL